MNFHKVLFFVIVSLLLFGCGRTNNYIEDSKTLLHVNNDAVSMAMYEKARSELAYSEYTDVQLIEGLALESFVLQQGVPLDVSVSKQEVQERYNELCNINDIYLEKVSEKYSDKKDLFEALYYRILYEKVQSKVQIDANDKFQFHEELLRQRTEDYLLQYNFNPDKREEYFSTVYNSYIDIQNSEIKELYFKAWQYRIVDRTALSSDNYDLSLLFCDIPYAIDQHKMSYGTDEYELTQLSTEKMHQLFGSILYIPTSVLDIKNNVVLCAYIPNKGMKGIYAKLSEIEITAIVLPRIALYHKQDSVEYITKDNGVNRIEIIYAELGIEYSIEANKTFDELRTMLYSMIPYYNVISN